MLAHHELKEVERLLPHAGVGVPHRLSLAQIRAGWGAGLPDHGERPLGLFHARGPGAGWPLKASQGRDVRGHRGHDSLCLINGRKRCTSMMCITSQRGGDILFGIAARARSAPRAACEPVSMPS